VTEDQDVGVGILLGHARIAAARRAGLVHDGEPQSRERGVCAFGQSVAQLGAVVVAPARDQPLGTGFEGVEQLRDHPVARMDHHVG